MRAVAKMCCLSCGRALPQPKVIKTIGVDPASLSDADLFKHYRSIAPMEDLGFFLRHAQLTPELTFEAYSLLRQNLPRAEHYRRLNSIKDRHRSMRFDQDRAAGIPAIGSPAWFEAHGITAYNAARLAETEEANRVRIMGENPIRNSEEEEGHVVA